MAMVLAAVLAAQLLLALAAWRRYLCVAKQGHGPVDSCPYSLTEGFGESHLVNVPHQEGVEWLTEIFSRSARNQRPFVST